LLKPNRRLLEFLDHRPARLLILLSLQFLPHIPHRGVMEEGMPLETVYVFLPYLGRLENRLFPFRHFDEFIQAVKHRFVDEAFVQPLFKILLDLPELEEIRPFTGLSKQRQAVAPLVFRFFKSRFRLVGQFVQRGVGLVQCNPCRQVHLGVV